MKRCIRHLIKALSAIMLATLVVPAMAQTETPAPLHVRTFPKAAVRGVLLVRTPPEISMDGKADRLSPGSRIRNTNNVFVLSGSLVGQELPVNYTRDSTGSVYEVWILNTEEVKEKRAGTPARNFSFGFESAAPAAQDDGKTPYDQLPRYK